MELKREISVVVPLYNEASNIEVFFSELNGMLESYGKTYEVIFADDGSIDDSHKILLGIERRESCVHVLSLKNNVGKAGALEQAFKLVSGDVVIIMDCDLQYDPSNIETLLEKIEEGYDVVSGKRVDRADSKSVKLTSWLFRLIVSKLSGLNFSDYFSGLKCFKVNVIDSLGVYGDLNRIFSVYAYRAGFKVCEVPITHRPRKHGASKYSFLGRLRLGVRDLLVLFFTVIVSREKLYKIGLLGFFLISLGFLIILMALFFSPLERVKDFLDNALIVIGVLCVYMGWQLRITELIGKDFLERHTGAQIFQEHDLRMDNVKYITPEKKELFEIQRYWKPTTLDRLPR